MVNIRDWARKKGFSDSDIEYDPTTKRIKVKGVDYGKGTPTYTTKYKPVRFSDVSGYSAPQKVQTGTKFDEEVLDDTFNRANLVDAQNRQRTAQEQYMNTLTTGYTPGVFQYDANKDSAYQAATADYQRRLNDMLRANMENASARGMYRSRSTSDRANQLVADETRRFNTDIAPQLEDRAYNRFVQNEGMKRNQWQDDVQRLAAALGITKENTASMQSVVDRSAQQRQGIADALSKMYGITVRPTVDTDAMYRQVQGMKTVAEREAERKRQEILEERAFKSKEAQKDRDFRAGQNRLDRASRASSGGSGGGSGSKTSNNMVSTGGQQTIDFKAVKTVDDLIRDRFKLGGSSSSGIDMPIMMTGSGTTTPTVGMTSTASMKALDNASKKTVRNMIDRSNLNYSERAYLYDTYGLGKRWGEKFKPTANAPAGSNWRAKEELGKQNIAVYVNKMPISEDDKVAMYEDMKRWYGFVN